MRDGSRGIISAAFSPPAPLLSSLALQAREAPSFHLESHALCPFLIGCVTFYFSRTEKDGLSASLLPIADEFPLIGCQVIPSLQADALSAI